MNSEQLYYRVSDACVRESLPDVGAALREYQIAHCYHPKKVYVWNPFTGQREEKEISCGKCYHCRETKVNSWVTRMYAHCADYAYVYFVTLTYRSFPADMSPEEKYLIRYLSGAMWHFDDLNDTANLSWNPCVLCKKHYQDFLKRLRKQNHLTDLTYFACGEYGKKWGRPHTHLILFSNEALTYDMIDRAWSLPLRVDDAGCAHIDRKSSAPRLASFGRIQFDDLVSNGSLNSNGLVVDGEYMSAHNCFAYVCKYLNKSERCNISRLALAFKSLYRDVKSRDDFYREYVSQFKDADDKTRKKEYKRYEKYKGDSSPLFAIPLDRSGDVVGYWELTKFIYNLQYNFFVPGNNQNFYYDSLPIFEDGDCTLPLYPTDFGEFCHVLRPFTSPSRGCPIGSLYVKTHIDSMADGVYKCPPLQKQGFVVPDYFRRKVSEYIYGLRSHTAPNSFSKGNLVKLYEDFMAEADCRSSDVAYVVADENLCLSDVLNSSLAFRDFRDGVRYLFCDDGLLRVVNGYKYNRKLRDYECVSTESPVDFCKRWLVMLNKAGDEYNRNTYLRQMNERFADLAVDTWLKFSGEDVQSLYDLTRDIVDRLEYEIDSLGVLPRRSYNLE